MKRISVPSKTFLIGEYAVLSGGPALVLLHEPVFDISIEVLGTKSGIDFHSESPAGLYCRQKNLGLSQFSFVDPHGGRGGFGASSAQFLAAWLTAQSEAVGGSLVGVLNSLIERDPLGRVSMKEETVSRILRDYRSVLSGPASGADVLAQLLGYVSLIDQNRRLWESWSWVFEKYTFSIYRTGLKVQTHVHLNQLGAGESYQVLEKHSRAAIAAFYDLRGVAFAESLNQFRDELKRLGLEHSHTTVLVEKFRTADGVLAAKGCGAMGADVVLVMHERESTACQKIAQELGLELVASLNSLSEGLRVSDHV